MDAYLFKSLRAGLFFMLFGRLLIFFKMIFFMNYSCRNTIRVSNSMDPDQARNIVGPDLGPNCLHKLSADDTSRQRVNDRFDLMLNIPVNNISVMLRCFLC